MAQWTQSLEPYIKVHEEVKSMALNPTPGEDLIIGVTFISDAGPSTPTLIRGQKEFLATYTSQDLSQEYLESLAEKLGPGSEQYKCAVQRLDEAIDHARSLQASGNVYSAEQWENHDVQRQVAAPNLNNKDQKLELYGIPVANSTVKHYQQEGEYVGYTNSFFRDFVTLVGSHKDWFKQI